MNAKKTSKVTADKPLYLVPVTQDQPFHAALYYASRKARRNKGAVALAYAIAPTEMRLNAGVEELMIEEKRKDAEKILSDVAARIEEAAGIKPVIYVLEGALKDQIFALMVQDDLIRQLVVGSTIQNEAVESFLAGSVKKMENNPKPVLIVPDTMTFEAVDAYLSA